MQVNLKYALVFYLLLVWSSIVNGQPPAAHHPHTVPSPNAASLGLFGEVPVSHFTGLPSISIPIHSATGQSLSLPISLDYHASGNRPEQQPGWVGLGWNLNVGGAITRTVKQVPDEYKIGTGSQVRPLGHFWWNHVGPSGSYPGYLSDSYWSDNSRVQYNPVHQLTDKAMDYAVDREPDEFSFNFLGYSGTFYLDQNHQWKVRSDKPLKVEFDNQFITPFLSPLLSDPANKLSQTFKHFAIIDEVGNRYIFGSETDDNDHAIEYSFPFESAPDGQMVYATTWYLTKIISANQSEVISYVYERGPFTSSVSYSYTTWTMGKESLGPGAPVCGESGTRDGFSGTIISPVYLKEITYPKKDLKIKLNYSKRNDLKYDAIKLYTGHLGYDPWNNAITVDANSEYIPFFSTNPNTYDNVDGNNNFIWIKLNNIVITSLNETIALRKVDFAYTESSTSRLKLNSLQIADNSNHPVQKYSFGYNSRQLPPYLTSITDHWGFNTGTTVPLPPGTLNQYSGLSYFHYNNASDLLSPTSTFRNPGSSGISTKAEILETITYPTGGKTTFEYELHDYNKAVSLTNRSQLDNLSGHAGGLRIKKITNTDILGHLETKEYIYKRGYTASSNVNNLVSSGILNVRPTYTFSVPKNPPIYFPSLGANFYYTYSTSTSIIPLTLNSSGVHVGYSEVVEKRSDGSYTIYKYTNHDVAGYTDPEPVNEFPALASTAELTRYIRYRTNKNDRGLLLSSQVYTNTDKLLRKKEINYSTVGNINTDVVRAVFWRHINICTFVSSDAGSGVLTAIAYTIPYYSKLPNVETELVYNQQDNNYVQTSTSYTYDQSTKLLKTIQTTRSDGQTASSSLYYPGDFASGQPYGEMRDKNMLDIVVKKEESVGTNLMRTEFTNYKKWHPNVYAPETIQYKVGTGPIHNKFTFHSYDVNGNPTESSEGNGGIRNATVWGYQSTLPVAIVRNAKHTDVFYTSFEEGDGNSADFDAKTGRKSFSGSYNKTLTNLSSGSYMLTYWQKSGITWSQVKVNNINVTGSYTINLSGQIDEVRFYPSNATMVSYTYDPLIGLSSSIDVRGVPTYFEYDSFQRLKNIKDQDGAIVKHYGYNYNEYVGNSEQVHGFFKNDCGGAGSGSWVMYVVPANTYTAPTLQAANALAQADITANGQSYANANGTCNIYARVERDNIYTMYDDVTADGLLIYTAASIYVRFYVDENCTIPYMLPANMDFTLRSGGVFTGGFYDDYYHDNVYTANANVSEFYLGDYAIYEEFISNNEYAQPSNSVTWTFDLITRAGSNYIPRPTL